jgi:RHS repeat-associated protein
MDLSGSLQGAGGIGGLLARSNGYNATTGAWSTHNDYHADGNGNITYLVNASQTLAASYKYDPFGKVIFSSGTLSSANTYQFSSKEYHARSGLNHYGYRWYDPYLQRWLNRDPQGKRINSNSYEFNFNSPLNFLDPYGRWGIKIGDINVGSGDPSLDCDFTHADWTDLVNKYRAKQKGLFWCAVAAGKAAQYNGFGNPLPKRPRYVARWAVFGE